MLWWRTCSTNSTTKICHQKLKGVSSRRTSKSTTYPHCYGGETGITPPTTDQTGGKYTTNLLYCTLILYLCTFVVPYPHSMAFMPHCKKRGEQHGHHKNLAAQPSPRYHPRYHYLFFFNMFFNTSKKKYNYNNGWNELFHRGSFRQDCIQCRNVQLLGTATWKGGLVDDVDSLLTEVVCPLLNRGDGLP